MFSFAQNGFLTVSLQVGLHICKFATSKNHHVNLSYSKDWHEICKGLILYSWSIIAKYSYICNVYITESLTN